MGIFSFFKQKNRQNTNVNANIYNRQKVFAILKTAAAIDNKFKLFGSKVHQYKLNSPIDVSVVHKAEKQYEFTLPDDYFKFITEIADGGAGLDYGIYSFTKFYQTNTNKDIKKGKWSDEYYEELRKCMAKPFSVRPMTLDDVENEFKNYAVNEYDYAEKSGKFFVCDRDKKNGEAALPWDDGFLVLGTHGCQFDFGIVITGERKGQIFTTNNDGSFEFLSNSFEEFYRKWLNKVSNIKEHMKKGLKKEKLPKELKRIGCEQNRSFFTIKID